MNRRTWLLLSTAFLAVLAIIVMANAASASLPAGPSAAAIPAGTNAQGQGAQAQSKDDPFGIASFNCADISRYGVDMQMNLRAAAILQKCGYAPKSSDKGSGSTGAGSGSSSGVPPVVKQLTSPLLGGSDVDVILPDGTYPHTVQSEDMTWAHGSLVVTNYNDSRTAGSCYGGISYSTDGGSTFQRSATQLCTGHGTNFGDPIVVYNAALNGGTWYAGDLVTGCGGQGIGLWTSTDGSTWTTGACAHNGGSDDRESMWVDNNPASPHYGRMYISFNNFLVGTGALQITYSDNGTTWSAAANIPANTNFIRDIQTTGDLSGSGKVYVAAMDESANGGLNPRINHMFRSTDGGVTWTDSVMGASFQGPGRAVSGYFALVFSSIWRHMGWGQPAANGNNVYYDWAQCGQNVSCSGATDHGDVYFQRSTDSGVTWSAPLKLNTDSGTAMQWQPSLATTAAGAVYAGWYDQRDASGGADLNCTVGSPTQGCYKRYGRVSLDGGATWQADSAVSDVLSPLPAQPDSAIQPTYEGDYDYISSDGNTVYDHWTDGRTLISNTAQQDVYLDRINVTVGTPTPTVTGTPPTNTPTPTRTNTPTATPTVCGATAPYGIATATGTIVAGTVDSGNHCDDCLTSITLPFSYSLYDQTFTSANVDSNGTLQLVANVSTFTNACLPATGYTYTIFPMWDDLYTINSGYGIFTSVSGSAPNRIFNIEWRAQYFPGSGNVHFEVRLYEGQHRFDVVYGAIDDQGASATVGVQKDVSNFTQYECNTGGLTNGLMLTFTQATCGTPGTPSPTPTQGQASATPTCQAGGGGLPGPWSLVANGATDLYGAASASDGTNAYFAGGYSFSSGTMQNILQRYNPATNTWTTLAPAPLAQGMGSLIYSPTTNKLYLFGGADFVAGVTFNTLYIYDIASNTWSTGAVMPDVRGFMASGYSNGHAYLVGGYSTGNISPAFSQVWDYNISAGTYTTRTPMPAPNGLGGAGSGVINGHLYVAGGRDSTNTVVNTLYDYNITADSWSTGAPMPSANNVPGSGVMSGDLFIFGGGNPFSGASPTGGLAKTANPSLKAAFPAPGAKGASPQTTGSTVYYDPTTNTWATGHTLNHIRSFPGGTNVGSTYLVTYGGYDGSSTTATAEVATGAGGGGCATPTNTPQATPTCQAGGTPGPWVAVAPVPYAARGPAVVSDGTYVYISGGYDGSTIHTDNMRYDPATNTYTTLAPSPDPHFLGQGVYDPSNNKIYIPDGFGASGQSQVMRIYDIASNTWTTGATPPAALSDLATMYYNGKVYMAAGYNGAATNALYAYDIAGNSWSTLASMPTALYLPGFGAINGKLYVASGNNGSSEVTDLQVYDIASNTWSMGAPVPTGVTGPASAVVNGKLWVIGGAAPFPTTTTMTQIYDPASNSWSTGPSMVTPRLWFYADVAGGKVVAPGGDTSPGIPINDNETASTGGGGGCGTPVATNTPAATATCQAGGTPGPWTAAAPYPINDVRYGFAQVGDSFYVIGGVSDGTRVANVNRYDVGSNTWTSLASIPVASEAPTCAYNSSSNKIYCAEGDTGNSFQIYDIASNTWTAGPAVPGSSDRYGASSGSFGNFVYIVGGSTGFLNDVQVYNISSNSWSSGTAAPVSSLLLAGYHEEGQYLYVVGGFNSGGPNGPNAAASSVIGKSKSHPAHPALGSNPSKSLPGAPDANNSTTLRLDMSSGTWSTGPAWTMSRADFGLAYSGGKLYAMGGDTTGGGFFDSSNEVDELDVSAWPSGSWTTSPPVLPAPNRQANQAGFTSADGRIWSVGGIDGSTFQFLPDNYYRSNGGGCGGGGTATPTPQATPTQCTSNGVQQVLYDQYGAPATDDTSQDFETAFDAYDNTAADDFVVPSGQTWTINEVDAGGDVSIARPASPLFNVYIYQNNGGQPGTQVYSALSQTTGGSGSDYNVTLSSPAVLSAGSYWVSVQARWDFNTDGQWYWQNQAAQAGNATQWQNPGDGFGSGCTSWADMQTCLGQSGNPDQVYRLIGSSGGGGCITDTPTPATVVPTVTPACTPTGAGWAMIAPIPANPGLGRTAGTYFPGTGMIYVLGGRSTNDPDTGSQTIYTYDPSSNTWGTASTTLTDTKVSNLAVALLNGPSGPRIYAVGGAYGSGSVDLNPTNIVRIYDPVSGSLTQADNWPQVSPLALPGGWAVYNNKLYIFGGFDPVNTAMINDIWTFDPMAAAGSQWTHQSATLALARSYIATQTIGNFIYLAGGFDNTLTDQVTAERYDPATNTICDACMADLPAATSNAKGYTDGTLFYVPGGGFPSPVDTTRTYDPATDTWNTLTSMAEPVRNYADATIGTDFYAMGGIASDGATFLADAEKYSQGAGCATPTTPPATPTSPAATPTSPAATPTSPAATVTAPPATATSPAATATSPAATVTAPPATATSPAATPTACTLQFRDVRQGSTFYRFIHCLVCLGIVNGYPDGTFRPNANLTRGQLAKIVSNSAGFNDTPTGQQFQDVPPTGPDSTFYAYIYRLVHRGYISGYPCGGPFEPCVPPDNLPYFRPNQPASRGQIAKIVSNAAGFNDTPTGQQFQDVPPTGPGSTFYVFIYRLVHRGIIVGYPCGTVPQEPCVPPQNLPYFRPNNLTTRGQMSKIDDLGFFPNCNLLARPANVASH